jgi:two-component system, LytTR family, sensor kinase
VEDKIQLPRQSKWLSFAAWVLLYFFWILVFQKREFVFSRTATVQFCYLIFVVANFYFNFYFNIPRFLFNRKYFLFAFLLFAGIAITALLRVPLATYLNRTYFIPGKPQPDFTALFSASMLNISIWTIALISGKLMIDRFRFQQYVNEIARQKERAELDFLNAQFNPHFLFNSINSIYAHIEKQNVVARNMLLTFSEMLRYQLYECNSNNIAIEREMNYVKNYVELQKARKDDTVVVDLVIDESVKNFTIAPLLFIAFIENSFKYVGAAEEKEKKVTISFKKRNDILTFHCCNTKEKNFINNIEHKGIGMSNAKRRLALLYPKKHSLLIADNNGSYEVNLNIHLS